MDSGTVPSRIAIVDLLSYPLLEQAARSARRGKYREAEETLESFVANNPSSVRGVELLAKIYAQQGKLEKAKVIWEKAIRLQPGTAEYIKAMDSCGSKGASFRNGIFLRKWIIFPPLLLAAVISTYLVVVQYQQRIAGGIMPSGTPIDGSRKGGDDNSKLQALVENALKTDEFIATIPLSLERDGRIIRARGTVPSLYIRYRVEKILGGIPGVDFVDGSKLELEKRYTVVEGDSLWGIADKVYGSHLFWKNIAALNRLKEPGLLRAGSRILLP